MRVKLVTGYVPIPGHPRSAAEYGELGEQLGTVGFSKQPFYGLVQDTWLWRFVEAAPEGRAIAHSVGDNPEKNTLEYHCVQHQKTEWLLRAAQTDTTAEIFVWVDYGILHVPGITVTVIEKLLGDIERHDDTMRGEVAIPGCWGKQPINDRFPHWRFCGGLIICPRHLVMPLDVAFKKATCRRVVHTRNVTWEVNDLARMEGLYKQVPLRWYQADHNETMFTAWPRSTPS